MLANYKIESSNYILRIASKDKGRLLFAKQTIGDIGTTWRAETWPVAST